MQACRTCTLIDATRTAACTDVTNESPRAKLRQEAGVRQPRARDCSEGGRRAGSRADGLGDEDGRPPLAHAFVERVL